LQGIFRKQWEKEGWKNGILEDWNGGRYIPILPSFQIFNIPYSNTGSGRGGELKKVDRMGEFL
jgi:hypothetical protein